MTKDFTIQIGNEYIAKRNYPFVPFNEVEELIENAEFSYDIQEGEKIKILNYFTDEKRFKVDNISLGNNGLAWVKLSIEELLKVLGKIEE